MPHSKEQYRIGTEPVMAYCSRYCLITVLVMYANSMPVPNRYWPAGQTVKICYRYGTVPVTHAGIPVMLQYCTIAATGTVPVTIR